MYEVGEAGGQAFIVMEHVEGQPLSSLIAPRGLPSDDVVRYGAQVADAIAHAHDRGVVHCDLKPQNIIITGDGRAKVLDFGIARRLSAAAVNATTAASATTLTPAIAGTLPYMAPEVLRGQRPDARSDIWSLGVVLHEMASGASAVHREFRLRVDGRDPGGADSTVARSRRARTRKRRASLSRPRAWQTLRARWARSVLCSRRVARWTLASGRTIDRVCRPCGQRPWRWWAPAEPP